MCQVLWEVQSCSKWNLTGSVEAWTWRSGQRTGHGGPSVHGSPTHVSSPLTGLAVLQRRSILTPRVLALLFPSPVFQILFFFFSFSLFTLFPSHCLLICVHSYACTKINESGSREVYRKKIVYSKQASSILQKIIGRVWAASGVGDGFAKSTLGAFRSGLTIHGDFYRWRHMGIWLRVVMDNCLCTQIVGYKKDYCHLMKKSIFLSTWLKCLGSGRMVGWGTLGWGITNKYRVSFRVMKIDYDDGWTTANKLKSLTRTC